MIPDKMTAAHAYLGFAFSQQPWNTTNSLVTGGSWSPFICLELLSVEAGTLIVCAPEDKVVTWPAYDDSRFA